MLDRKRTADTLKANLDSAFARWRELDKSRNTKAELARRCAQARGLPCTAQDVNSWFKTGRMDKAWLAYVERVLGQSLGFGMQASLDHEGLTPETLHLRHEERDLILAFRRLPADEQEDLLHNVMERAAKIDRIVERALAERGIHITGYVTAERAAASLPSAPRTSVTVRRQRSMAPKG